MPIGGIDLKCLSAAVCVVQDYPFERWAGLSLGCRLRFERAQNTRWGGRYVEARSHVCGSLGVEIDDKPSTNLFGGAWQSSAQKICEGFIFNGNHDLPARLTEGR